jgi:hypothetical protein
MELRQMLAQSLQRCRIIAVRVARDFVKIVDSGSVQRARGPLGDLPENTPFAALSAVTLLNESIHRGVTFAML